VLTDRLYRRYLRLDELELATRKMRKVWDHFSSLPSTYLGPDRLAEVKTPDSRLDLGAPSLATMFARYFEHFDYCVESAKLNYEAFKAHPGYVYEPVRVIVTDMPRHMIDSARSLAEYDALVGDPIWLS